MNGKRNGKVKIYNGSLFYEGDYLNNKRHGKGKTYYYWFHNNNLFYEGEYYNDQRHGFGKKYETDGKLYYEGDIKMEKSMAKEKNIKMVN